VGLKLDHLRIPVSGLARSRAWYVTTLGLKTEFEVPDRQTVALQDTDEFAIFLQQVSSAVRPNGCALRFQVGDVDATFAQWSARGVEFAHGPEKTYWIRCRTEGPRRIPDPSLGCAFDEASARRMSHASPTWCAGFSLPSLIEWRSSANSSRPRAVSTGLLTLRT
jgi:catechol 2,3-dioxygenase-like lactoylglutathione lyase family enzyme